MIFKPGDLVKVKTGYERSTVGDEFHLELSTIYIVDKILDYGIRLKGKPLTYIEDRFESFDEGWYEDEKEV